MKKKCFALKNLINSTFLLEKWQLKFPKMKISLSCSTFNAREDIFSLNLAHRLEIQFFLQIDTTHFSYLIKNKSNEFYFILLTLTPTDSCHTSFWISNQSELVRLTFEALVKNVWWNLDNFCQDLTELWLKEGSKRAAKVAVSLYGNQQPISVR